MAILLDEENKELIITCDCGCEDACHIKIEKDDFTNDYALLSYMNGKFYNDTDSILDTIKRKCKKIWAIIRNKDYYYSDIIMTEEDYKKFKKYVNLNGKI